MRSMFEESMMAALRRHTNNRNIQEWADAVLRRVRAIFQAGTPAAVAERTANRAQHEGYLKIYFGPSKVLLSTFS